MIRHTVVFVLRHAPGSAAETAFLAAALALADIPGVQRFEQLRQISPQSDFTYSFAMEFADQSAYDAYNAHPVHVEFVATRWAAEVERFQELDFIPLAAAEAVPGT